MTPEEGARQEIDRLLEAACWQVQDYKNLNLGAALGVAISEFPRESGFPLVYAILLPTRRNSTRHTANIPNPYLIL